MTTNPMKTRGNKTRFTAIDLFAGCGGLSLGLERAGFRILSAVELDSAAAATYRQNHPDTVVIEKDIKKVSTDELLDVSKLGATKLDLLAGCPPCQGFSRITKKNRMNTDDPRNDLIYSFLRIAKALKPKLVLMENVPGLAKDRRFRRFVSALRAKGYQCEWDVLNAADFGVPQRRKRLIFMASRIGPVHLPTAGQTDEKTVRDVIGSLESPKFTSDPLQKMYLKSTPRIKELIKRIPHDGGSRSSLPVKFQLECHKSTEGFKDVYGRMRWQEVSPTLTSGCYNPSKGRFLHPRQNRPITLREAALLQSFPKSYVFPVSAGLTTIARMIGDALPPAFGTKQGRELVKTLAAQ